MILCDVNVLVYAFREDMEHHRTYHDWLSDAVNGDEPLGISGLAASGFVRVVTNRRVFVEPSRPETAFQFLRDLRASPIAVPLQEGPRHWDIFEGLCTKVGAKGNVVPDAYLAALAIEAGCTLASADRGFARFPGLRWLDPLDAGHRPTARQRGGMSPANTA
jgi:hypothetical protein